MLLEITSRSIFYEWADTSQKNKVARITWQPYLLYKKVVFIESVLLRLGLLFPLAHWRVGK
jgi:hypothetical protein